MNHRVARDLVHELLKAVDREVPEYQVDRIIALVGGSTEALNKSVERLDLYMGSSKDITVSEIDNLFTTPATKGYNYLIDLIGRRDLEALLKFTGNIKDEGFAFKFISYFASWIDKAFSYMVKKQEGIAEHRIMERLHMNQYEVRTMDNTCKGFTHSRLVKILNALADLDFTIKSEYQDANKALQGFFLLATKGD